MRRSLTVTPENDKKILLAKGRFLTGDAPFDIDYTTMVNIFIELGHKLMSQAWNNDNPNVTIAKNEIIESFKKHFFDAELKEEAVGDLVAEIIFKKLVEQSSLAACNPLQQPEQPPQLPAGQPKKKDTTKEKYIA